MSQKSRQKQRNVKNNPASRFRLKWKNKCLCCNRFTHLVLSADSTIWPASLILSPIQHSQTQTHTHTKRCMLSDHMFRTFAAPVSCTIVSVCVCNMSSAGIGLRLSLSGRQHKQNTASRERERERKQKGKVKKRGSRWGWSRVNRGEGQGRRKVTKKEEKNEWLGWKEQKTNLENYTVTNRTDD